MKRICGFCGAELKPGNIRCSECGSNQMENDMRKKVKTAECWLCRKKKFTMDEAEDYFCSGCKKHICEDCEKPDPPMGFGHDPMDHMDHKER